MFFIVNVFAMQSEHSGAILCSHCLAWLLVGSPGTDRRHIQITGVVFILVTDKVKISGARLMELVQGSPLKWALIFVCNSVIFLAESAPSRGWTWQLGVIILETGKKVVRKSLFRRKCFSLGSITRGVLHHQVRMNPEPPTLQAVASLRLISGAVHGV